MSNEYLPSLVDRIRKSTERARTEFASLSPEQLNWKPDPKSWSVGQCIDHLIVSNTTYFPKLETFARGPAKPNFWERMRPFSGMFSRMLLKGTTPEPTRKMKRPGSFAPAQSAIPTEIVEKFAVTNVRLIELMEATDALDHKKTYMSSPAASFLTYNLHDAFVILVQHEERHLNQAARLMERPEFPS